ncbi:MAG: NAD(P)H-dependent oxidoreductase subunit E [Spirochaetales bacterium]|nr:NAD(P)H-dependent oxidoreductase subunit E [Spirochaetales bacterium]
MAEIKDLIETIIMQYNKDKGMLIPMMQDIQNSQGYLPPDYLRVLSKELCIPLSQIFSVATFYSSFRLAPKGRHEITLCMGTVCYLKGAGKISEIVCEKYNIQPGGTTEDRLFTLAGVNCVGACALAPVMIVDGKYYNAMTPDKVLEIISNFSTAKQNDEKEEK